jgi:hypothetical protein
MTVEHMQAFSSARSLMAGSRPGGISSALAYRLETSSSCCCCCCWHCPCRHRVVSLASGLSDRRCCCGSWLGNVLPSDGHVRVLRWDGCKVNGLYTRPRDCRSHGVSAAWLSTDETRGVSVLAVSDRRPFFRSNCKNGCWSRSRCSSFRLLRRH